MSAADRDQLGEEAYSRTSGGESRPDPEALSRTRYSEDELDNQDPHGKHARLTLDAPAQDLNTHARVGERAKPGTTLRLERTDNESAPDRPEDSQG